MINRQGVTLSVLGCGVAVLVACGSDGHTPFVTPSDGGGRAIGDRAGAGGPVVVAVVQGAATRPVRVATQETRVAAKVVGSKTAHSLRSSES
jgi:hypothetical protein